MIGLMIMMLYLMMNFIFRTTLEATVNVQNDSISSINKFETEKRNSINTENYTFGSKSVSMYQNQQIDVAVPVKVTFKYSNPQTGVVADTVVSKVFFDRFKFMDWAI